MVLICFGKPLGCFSLPAIEASTFIIAHRQLFNYLIYQLLRAPGEKILETQYFCWCRIKTEIHPGVKILSTQGICSCQVDNFSQNMFPGPVLPKIEMTTIIYEMNLFFLGNLPRHKIGIWIKNN